jgi:outer membrane lipoprotein-sorting protein/peroxiredoxin
MHTPRNLLHLALCLTLAPVAHSQTSAQSLLARVAAASAATRSLRADVVLTRHAGDTPELRSTGTVLLSKPNLALVHLTGNDPVAPLTTVSDGTALFTLLNPAVYSKDPSDPHAANLAEPWWNIPTRYFFSQSFAVFSTTPDPTAVATLLHDETLNGQPIHVISVQGAGSFPYTERLYITFDDQLIRTVVQFGPSTTFTAELSHVERNVPVQNNAFHFTPPANARLKEADPTAKMLAIGSLAPAFTLPAVNGSATSLFALRKGAKATLVNFWYLDCAPCRLENPEFQKLYDQFHAQGFNIVAIDKADAATDISAYLKRNGLTYPVLLGGEDTARSVFARYQLHNAYPGTYLLDANGRIVYRAVGADIDGLRRALAKLGFK